MKRLLIVATFIIAITGIGLFLYYINVEKENPNEIVLYGNVDVRQVDIGFRVPGRVTELFFDEGDFVPKDTLMAVLDQSPYDSQIAEARANLESVRANLKNANIQLDRRQLAVGFGGVSQEDVDNASASSNILLANLYAAEAALNVAIDNMKYTEVRAPTDGIILSRIREPGTVVNAVDPVYTLSVCSPVWIRAYVDEPQLGLIYYGMKAEIHTDSGQVYAGQIGFISPMAEFTPKTVETAQLRTDLVYRLRVYADNPDHFLKQGMPVTVKLHLAREKKVSDPLVVIQNLQKVFAPNRPAAIDGVNATIPKGEIVGLAGPDGAGKTTLIRLIAGLLLPTKGTVTVAGHDTARNPEPIHSLTGYMPQKFGLYEDLTVMQNLVLYADLRGVLGQEREETFERLLKFTDLAPFTKRLAGDLSGGMKQKLGLACALIKKPLLLLLDEPSVGVDSISRRELWKMVTLLLDEGISVLWSTAYLNEVERCHTVLLLNEGKLLYHGPPGKLTERVRNRVFKITDIQGNRRKLLFELLKQQDVIDGVIQGADLRIVTREEGIPSFAVAQQFSVQNQEPRFEDAFIDILGGGPGGRSDLADQRLPVTEEIDTPIEAEGLTKKFGNFTAVEGMDFKIRKGEIFGLLGPNGAGKSTTFKMLCGLLQPTQGKARVQGFDLSSAQSKARSRIGYMAQKFSLYGALSVQQNLSFFAGIYDLKNKAKDDAIEKMVNIFSLRELLSTTSESLPLGFKQRLSLACANMHDPVVIFLDEPTSGVDPITRREFWNHINGLVEKGVTVMVTTHFMDEAEYCDRIALIYHGKVIHMDTPDALKKIAQTPQNPNPTLEDAFVQLIEEYDRR